VSIKDDINTAMVQAREFADNCVGFVGVDMARVSDYLLAQLYEVSITRAFNFYSVTDVLQGLEGERPGICAKEEDQFQHKPLQGLWKAHFNDPRFLLDNLELEAKRNKKSRKSKILAFMQEEAESPSKVGVVGKIAHMDTFEAYEKRAARKGITSHWIVYGKHESKNYYLGVGKHTERGKLEQDTALYELLLEACGDQFPFLFSGQTEADA